MWRNLKFLQQWHVCDLEIVKFMLFVNRCGSWFAMNPSLSQSHLQVFAVNSVSVPQATFVIRLGLWNWFRDSCSITLSIIAELLLDPMTEGTILKIALAGKDAIIFSMNLAFLRVIGFVENIVTVIWVCRLFIDPFDYV